jgi:pimeloyl-ACP methyl ester carboxylesterase
VSRYLPEDAQNSDGVAVYDFTTNLSQFTTPVLFITGALSEVLGKSLQDEQMNVYPSASLVVIDGAGHDVHWIKTVQVVGLIRAYLGGL